MNSNDVIRDFEVGHLGPQDRGIDVEISPEAFSQLARNGKVGLTGRDPIVEMVREDLLSRSQLGLKKYGVGLDREDLSLREFCQHLYEEILDSANYLKRIMIEIDQQSK